MSKEKVVMSDIHQGLVLRMALFNIFTADMNSRIDSTVSKFVHRTTEWLDWEATFAVHLGQPPVKQIHQGYVAQGFIQAGFDCLWGSRFHNLSAKPVAMVCLSLATPSSVVQSTHQKKGMPSRDRLDRWPV